MQPIALLIDIPNGSHIYIQTPQNQFLTGILHLGPLDFLAEISIHTYNDLNLSANLHPLEHNTNYVSREYLCYIPLPNGSFLTSALHPFNYLQDAYRRMCIAVRFQNPTVLLRGVLRHGFGPLPAWIPRQNY